MNIVEKLRLIATGYAHHDLPQNHIATIQQFSKRRAWRMASFSRAAIAVIEWLPALREFARLVQSEERERCAQYLLDAAKGLPPYTAHVLACKGDELAAGRAWREVGEGEKK